MASAGRENNDEDYLDFEDDYGHQSVERDRLDNTIMNLFRSFLQIIGHPNGNDVTFPEAHAHFLHYIDDTVFLCSTRLLSGGGEVQLLPDQNTN